MKKNKIKYLEPIMRRDINYIQGIEVEETIEIVRHCFFSDSEMKFAEHIVRNAKEFQQVYREMLKYWTYERFLSEAYAATKKEVGKYYGICEVCNSAQPLIVDYQSAEIQGKIRVPNWRERLVCPNCGCNNRQRFILRTIYENYRIGMDILLYEQISNVYKQVQREIRHVSGFEYWGSGFESGAVYNQIEYQDICRLSYPDESFDLIIANDIFEHAPDYIKAFKEAYRVLKQGGKLIFTIPFNANSENTEVRAIVENEQIRNILEPMYHSNPIETCSPLLVYQIFGWDMFGKLLKCGFADAYGKVYYGMKEGYLGYLPLYFEAYK